MTIGRLIGLLGGPLGVVIGGLVGALSGTNWSTGSLKLRGVRKGLPVNLRLLKRPWKSLQGLPPRD